MKRYTSAERILWERLKGKKLYGYKFRRQYKVIHYIVDFYCPQVKLAIEVDGPYHFEEYQMIYDKIRQSEIELLGIRFLRFTNYRVINSTSEVIREIADYIRTSTSP